MSLARELEHIINKCNVDSDHNTPDFILAQYLLDCLAAFKKATDSKTSWDKLDD